MFMENEIVQGDCLKVLANLSNDSVDLVVTDPPYLANFRDRLGRTLANDDKPGAVVGAYSQLYRVLKPNTFCVTFYGYPRLHYFVRAWTEAGFDTVGHIVWPKSYASSARFVSVQHESAYVLVKGRPVKPAIPPASVQKTWRYTGNRVHPTEKSVDVLRPLIESYSRPGDLVLDPFSGSGSTSCAAAMVGRRYLGIELESRYCEYARQRLVELRSPGSSHGAFSEALSEFQHWMRDQRGALS
jgi:DNA modification methylase